MSAVQVRAPDRPATNDLSRYLPILAWLPSYDRAWLAGDLAAGATVAAIVVPEGVAYAGLAGMPPQASLYAAPVALVAYAVFGRCRHMILGATSAVSLMSAAIVADIAPQGTDRFITLSTTLALVAGLLFLLFGAARLGFVANFFSEPVLKGFVFGLALVIAIGQAPKLFGLERGEGSFVEKAWHLLSHLGDTSLITLMVGLASLALLFAVERYAERVPGALIALIFGIGVVSLFGLHERGVKIVGEIPGGFPRLIVPDLQPRDVLALLPGAVGLVLLDLESTSEIDVASLDMLGELDEQLDGEGVALWLCRVRSAPRRLLDKSGVSARVGEEHIYPRAEDGVEAFQRGREGEA